MNSLVLIKQVPDTGMSLRFQDHKLNEDSLKWVLSPYDEFALEEALKLKNQLGGDSKVFVLSLGPARSKEALMQGLALGADEAFHLKTEEKIVDPLTQAQILKENFKNFEDISFIFCGKQSSDFNNFAVPQMLGGLLNRPFVTNVNHLSFADGHLELTRESASGLLESLKLSPPAIISADKGLNTPRYPSLPGIMQAKKKPFHEIDIQKPKERFTLKQLSGPEERKEAHMIAGSPDEQVQELIKILKEQEKVL